MLFLLVLFGAFVITTKLTTPRPGRKHYPSVFNVEHKVHVAIRRFSEAGVHE